LIPARAAGGRGRGRPGRNSLPNRQQLFRSCQIREDFHRRRRDTRSGCIRLAAISDNSGGFDPARRPGGRADTAPVTKDHIVPLACGGPDTVVNFQWQTKVAAKAKDGLGTQGLPPLIATRAGQQHIDSPAAAAGTDKPLASFENAGFGAVAPRMLDSIGLNLMLAIFAPRSAARGRRRHCLASSADPTTISCAAQRPARRLCLAVARGGAY
jgi:hypothetical protein